MVDIRNYFNDGANAQAQAVLCSLKYNIGDGIEESWSSDQKQYMADIKVARWENGREQGYIVSLRAEDRSKQINIAWFEHRNSDAICAITWEQLSFNSLNIDTANFKDIYKDKSDVSKSVNYEQFAEMSEYIFNTLVDFWVQHQE